MKLDAAIIAAKTLEGFRAKPYLDQAGIWTVGYGTTYLVPEGYVTSETPEMTEERATAALTLHITILATQIAAVLKRLPSEGQMNAMVLFAYNVGIGAFLKSTLLKLFNNNAGDEDMRKQFLRWTKITDPKTKRKFESAGLVKRREIEYRMYLSGGPNENTRTPV